MRGKALGLTIVALACLSRGAQADLLEDWRLDMTLGYAGAHGDVRGAWGDGVVGGAGVGRRVTSRLAAEAGLTFARIGDSFGATVLARECLPPVAGTPRTCSTVPETQHVETASVSGGV